MKRRALAAFEYLSTSRSQQGEAIVRAGEAAFRRTDEDGVLVLKPSSAAAIARKALAIQANEPGIIARLLAGEKLDAVYDLAG